jgi:hypothetical protein
VIGAEGGRIFRAFGGLGGAFSDRDGHVAGASGDNQIGQGEERMELSGVLVQTAVAHLAVFKLNFSSKITGVRL